MECGRTSSPEELVDSWNGECNIPLRAFSSEELLKATNNFHPHNIITEDAFYLLYRGSFEECPVLVKKFGKEGSFWPHEDINLYATHDMAITSQLGTMPPLVKTDVYAFGMIMLELLTGKRTVDANRDGIGVDQEQQFRAFVELALRCVEEKREDKPEMKGVADELSRIRRSVDAN
ncbi:hypothetical protein C3L33_19684, partial [Rhododendron williamsianum]